MDSEELCRVFLATHKWDRSAALADVFGMFADLNGDNPTLVDVCMHLQQVLNVDALQRIWVRSEPSESARAQVERELSEDGIIEDPDVDGGLVG